MRVLAAIAVVLLLGATPKAPSTPPSELVEVEVKDVVPIEATDLHAVMLVTKSEGTIVPVFVDAEAALTIAFGLAHRDMPGGGKTALLERALTKLGGQVTEIRIRAIQDDAQVSSLMLRQGKKDIEVPAKPSESISLAVTRDAKIFATRSLVRDVGITKEELSRMKKERPGTGGSGPPSPPSDGTISL